MANDQNSTNDVMRRLEQLCKISLCPPEEYTDFDKLFSNSGLMNGDAERFVIEFGSDDVDIRVTIGQVISANDIIAYMGDIPVNSKVNGKITEINDRYIIGEYINDTDSILNKLKSEMPEETITIQPNER